MEYKQNGQAKGNVERFESVFSAFSLMCGILPQVAAPVPRAATFSGVFDNFVGRSGK
jgi:hypothetical protein